MPQIWDAFSCYLHFEIRLFALLPTNYSAHFQREVKAAMQKHGYYTFLLGLLLQGIFKSMLRIYTILLKQSIARAQNVIADVTTQERRNENSSF